jgi:hypothetical protein
MLDSGTSEGFLVRVQVSPSAFRTGVRPGFLLSNQSTTVMIKNFIVGAFVLFSGAANATPTIDALFNAIKATGTEVAVNHPSVCANREVMGMYQYQRSVVDRLTICIDNHNGDNAELYDTILHESVHVAQACKGSYLFTPVSIVQQAKPEEIVFLNQRYTQGQFQRELEARVIARDQDEVYVTELIKEHCK